MKRLRVCFLFTVIIIASTAIVNAQIADSACFYYVLQNPKYCGDKAQSWFEISGLKDKKVEDRINKVLRKTFHEKSGLEVANVHGWSQKDTITPIGYTDYTYPDQTFHYDFPQLKGWVRFKDSDTLLRLKKANDGYGTGKNLHSFHWNIAPDKMAYICMQVWDKKHPGEYDAVELTFSLVDGRKMPSKYVVHINPALKDSLTGILDRNARESAKNVDGTPLNCKLIPGRPASDSCIITSEALICWFTRETLGAPSVYGRSYSAQCDPSMSMAVSTGLYLQPMIQFLIEDEWNKLQEIYK